jgi:hypothetical protein
MMQLISLAIAEVHGLLNLPYWYKNVYDLHVRENNDKTAMEIIDDFMKHGTDHNLVFFLRQLKYPSKKIKELLGPLLNQVSLCSPFFRIVPLDESQPVDLRDIEREPIRMSTADLHNHDPFFSRRLQQFLLESL